MSIIIGEVISQTSKSHIGEVLVKYTIPESNETKETWLPVAMLSEGSLLNKEYLLKVSDKVLIACVNEGKEMRRYIIGVVPSAKTEKIYFKTENGHELLIDDSKSWIQLSDKNNENFIRIDNKNGNIEINAENKITISAGSSKVIINNRDKTISLNGNIIQLEASQKVNLKTLQALIDASTVNIKASAQATLESPGIVNIKGSFVKLG